MQTAHTDQPNLNFLLETSLNWLMVPSSGRLKCMASVPTDRLHQSHSAQFCLQVFLGFVPIKYDYLISN